MRIACCITSLPPLPSYHVFLPLTFTSVVDLRHFGTCGRAGSRKWSLKGLSFVLRRFKPAIIIDVKHWFTFFTLLAGRSRRWNQEAFCLPLRKLFLRYEIYKVSVRAHTLNIQGDWLQFDLKPVKLGGDATFRYMYQAI